ncbi:MAG: multidrug transporter [Clostridiales bacterium]|nr:multidrug transporter [Clostridiales bacterium]
MNTGVDERDWKLFRRRVPAWQERWMERLDREYLEILQSEEKASERFWALEKRIREDKKGIGVVIDMRRSQMEWNIMRLLGQGVITLDELEGFSEELRARFEYFSHARHADDQ